MDSPEISAAPLLDPEDSSDNVDVRVQEVQRSTTFLQILIHLFKSNIGVGLLNMPENMSRAGILLGPLISIAIIFPIIHCMFLLLNCSRELKKRYGKQVIGYAGTFRYSLEAHFPNKAKYAAYLGNLFLLSSQLGVCTAYIIFTAETLQEASDYYFPDTRKYMVIIGCVLLPFVLITSLDAMAVLSGGATVFCMFSLACTFFYICVDLKDPRNYPLVAHPSKLPLFLSSLMYVYEGINVIIPLDNEIINPDRYPLAVKISTYGSGLIYFLIGLLGYIAYGENAKSSVTLNLPFEPFTNIVKVVYALGVIMTFFIQFHVAMRAIIPTIIKLLAKNPMQRIFVNVIFRILFVVLIVILAVAIPQLSNLISLIGALSCTSLSLIFPCIIHLATFWNPTDESQKISTRDKLKDGLLIFLGVILACTGIFTAVKEIYIDYNKSPNSPINA